MRLRFALALLPLSLAPGILLLSLVSSCSDTPRGEQGIDYLSEAGTEDAGPLLDVGPDARGPCVETTDTAGVCSQVTSSGTPYPHLITCTGAEGPALLQCLPSGAATTGDTTTYCCTTGIL